MTKDQQPKKPAAADNRAASRHRKQSQGSPLSAANVEESPFMDRGDSAAGAGETLGEAQESKAAGEGPGGTAIDTQYGTKSSLKTRQKSALTNAKPGRASSGGSGASGGADKPTSAPDPGSSEDSAGAERDTMTGTRPGGRS